jgi:hypothetical protein
MGTCKCLFQISASALHDFNFGIKFFSSTQTPHTRFIITKFLGQTIKRDGFAFPFSDQTTIHQLKQEIIDAQVEWRKERLSKQHNDIPTPPFKIIQLYYIDNIASKIGYSKVTPLDESFVAAIPGLHLHVKMEIPTKWKFIGEINRDSRKINKKDCSRSNRTNDRKKRVKFENCPELVEGGRLKTEDTLLSTSHFQMQWMQLLLVKLAEIDAKIFKLPAEIESKLAKTNLNVSIKDEST